MAKLTYANKVALNQNISIPDENKITDTNMNDIKSVTNENDDRLTTVETNGIIGATQYGGTIVTNLNTISKGGFYTALGTATGVPNSSYSWFITHQNSNTGTLSATQRAVAYSTSLIIYERVMQSGTWGAWVNRSTVNNLTTASAGKGVLDAYQGKVLNDNITNIKWKILWTNPNPTSAFADQSVTLNSSDYDELMFIFDVYANFKQLLSVTTLKGYGLSCFGLLQDGTGALRKMQRLATRTNDTTYSIGLSIYDFGSSAAATDNSQLVPIYVLGRKSGII